MMEITAVGMAKLDSHELYEEMTDVYIHQV